jgi:hypothetical protein
MSSLEGRSLSSTYKDLLQVSNNNSGITNTSSYVEDGEGTSSILALSQSHVGINTTSQGITNGVLAVSGDSLFSGNVILQGDILFANDGHATGLHTGSVINDLSDVDVTGVSAGTVLKYNGTNWVPSADSVGVTTLSGLNDVTASAPLNGDVLRFDSGMWYNVPARIVLAGSSISDLGDVNLDATIPDGDVLQFDSSTGKFVNAPIPVSTGGSGTSSLSAWSENSSGHLLPNSNATYDIGNPQQKVRHFYLSDNSLKFIGADDVERSLGVSDGELTFNDAKVRTDGDRWLKISDANYPDLILDTESGTGFGTISFTGSMGLIKGKIMYRHPENTMGFYTNGSSEPPDMQIDSAGNVGIGTTGTPTEKLEVAGNIKATQFVGDGNALTNLPGGSGTWSSSTHTNFGYNYNTAAGYSGQPVASHLIYHYNNEWVFAKGYVRWQSLPNGLPSPFWLSPSNQGPQGGSHPGYYTSWEGIASIRTNRGDIYKGSTSTPVYMEPCFCEYNPGLNRIYIQTKRNSVFDANNTPTIPSGDYYLVFEVLYRRA